MTRPTKSLDETAGKQPWSESGLVLLDTLHRTAATWKTPIAENYNRCSKPHCAYCLWIERMNVLPVETHTIILQSRFNDFRYTHQWDAYELQLLFQNIDKDVIFLTTILPSRSKSAIMAKRQALRRKLNMSLMKRGGNKRVELNRIIK